jgi:hypothetical protein
MGVTIITIMATVALALGVVSAGVNYKTIYEIEMDRHYVAVTEQQLADQYKAVAEKLDDARRRNDTVAAAEYGTILNGITQIRNRSNITAIGRQVEQRKAAFIEEQWSVFQANVAIGVVSWGMGQVGFGKVTDTYMQGNNWPPNNSIALWNPIAGQSERLILGSRPELVINQFSDDLGDFMNAVLNGFDVARTVTVPEGDIQSALDASTFVSEEMDQINNVRPLPKDIGDYLAASMIKQIQRENPQIATEPFVDQAIFVRTQSCQSLNRMWLDEQRDQTKSEALWEAMKKLECDKLAGSAAQTEQGGTNEESTVSSGPDTEPEEPAASPDNGAANLWVRDDEPVINRQGNPIDNSFHDQKTVYQVSESNFSWQDSYVVEGEDRHHLEIEVRFAIPPKELTPGQEIALTAAFSGGGTLSTVGPYSAEFAYSADMGTFDDQETYLLNPWDRYTQFIEPGSGFSYTPWLPSFSGPSDYTWVLTVPEFGEYANNVFEVWVYWRACLPCDVTWTYRMK